MDGINNDVHYPIVAISERLFAKRIFSFPCLGLNQVLATVKLILLKPVEVESFICGTICSLRCYMSLLQWYVRVTVGTLYRALTLILGSPG